MLVFARILRPRDGLQLLQSLPRTFSQHNNAPCLMCYSHSAQASSSRRCPTCSASPSRLASNFAVIRLACTPFHVLHVC